MKRPLYILGLIFILASFVNPPGKKTQIFLAGDSTMSIKETKYYPETGWGMPFVYFWDSSVSVINLAKNGRSTKSFILEGLWKSVADNISEGDYVLIQFGHNDEVKEKIGRYTTPDSFAMNLEGFVRDARAKKANPVLLSPVARRLFDEQGKAVDTHTEYAPIVKTVAQKLQVPFIDLNKLSLDLYNKMGTENTKLLFLQTAPGEHPNYPEGKIDNTHFNELGARLIAQIVLAEIKRQVPALADKIIKPKKE